jgi:cell division protein FtsB
MRKWRIWLAVAVWALAILIQKPLWFGQGGWFHVGELEHKLVEAKQDIEHEKTENEALVAEVRSLKEGTTAIEERARRELYMVRNGEVLFRVKASPEEQAKQAAEEAARAGEGGKPGA